MSKKPLGTHSLLDLAENRVVDWYVVYRHRFGFRWWAKLLQPGFRHVELWRPERYGPQLNDLQWLVVDPCFEFLEAKLRNDPTPPWLADPTCTVQKVRASRRLTSIRDYFFIGPMTCVEYTKAALGIRHFALRTPYQLYKYIAKRSGVIQN